MAKWVEDCWHERYDGAPADDSVWIEKANCTWRELRGGSWDNAFDGITSAHRRRVKATGRRSSRRPVAQ
jgi:formylglycine-generating enzyme required for sulfatase activity